LLGFAAAPLCFLPGNWSYLALVADGLVALGYWLIWPLRERILYAFACVAAAAALILATAAIIALVQVLV